MDKKKIPFPSRVEGFLDCCGMLNKLINPYSINIRKKIS